MGQSLACLSPSVAGLSTLTDARRADLATMETKLEANSYETLDQFLYDAKLIFKNCRQYNDGGSNCACRLPPLRPCAHRVADCPFGDRQTSRTPTSSRRTSSRRSRCTSTRRLRRFEAGARCRRLVMLLLYTAALSCRAVPCRVAILARCPSRRARCRDEVAVRGWARREVGAPYVRERRCSVSSLECTARKRKGGTRKRDLAGWTRGLAPWSVCLVVLASSLLLSPSSLSLRFPLPHSRDSLSSATPSTLVSLSFLFPSLPSAPLHRHPRMRPSPPSSSPGPLAPPGRAEEPRATLHATRGTYRRAPRAPIAPRRRWRASEGCRVSRLDATIENAREAVSTATVR